jgi:hypothetical protein
MAINIKRKTGCRVPKIGLNRLDIVSALNGSHCVGVPLRYNNDKPEKSRIFKGFQGFKPDF